jgi:AbrB family looped-hinge helix DNA binding protein
MPSTTEAPAIGSVRAKIGPGGRLVIPVAQRRALGLEVGDPVVIRVEDDELRIVGLDHRIKRVQALVRQHNPSGELLSESLIRDRRAAAARE